MENLDKPQNPMGKIIAGIILIILVVIFALQNSESTLVKLYFWDANAPLVLLFLLCFTAGLCFAILALLPVSRNSKRKTKLIDELKSRIEILESQLKDKI